MPLALLWSLINNLQTIVMLSGIALPIPGLASIFISQILQIATLDVLPTQDIYPYIFTFDSANDNPLTDALN